MNEQELMTQIYKVFHPSLPRLGPGLDACTLQALRLVPPEWRQADRHLLDLGCGNGAQTICLAGQFPGRIRAVDTHQPFLDRLRERALAAGCKDRIETLCADMATICPEQGPFDLIWCEGAIYNMGFERGVRHCRHLLGEGYLALTDLNWLGAERPLACQAFFEREGLPVLAIDDNLRIIRSCGFEVVGHFALPASAWWTEFYHPLSQRLEDLRQTAGADQGLMEMVGIIEEEIAVFRDHPGVYGYVFYVARTLPNV